jgi:hypothetical protein
MNAVLQPWFIQENGRSNMYNYLSVQIRNYEHKVKESKSASH